MKYIFTALFLFFLYQSLKAQDCSCSENFQQLTDKIKKNYVGYSDKVNSSNRVRFQNFTDSLQKIAMVSDSYTCLSLSREWLAFFKDKHISFGLDFDKLSTDSIKLFFQNVEKTNWSEASFNAYLQQNINKVDSLEGIWNHENNTYKLGIVRDGTKKDLEFIAFIIKSDGLRWLPQQVKFRVSKFEGKYKTVYFSAGDHSIVFPTLSKVGETLDFGIFGKWYKGDKKQAATAISPYKQSHNTTKFTKLDDETSLLTLPSFNSKYKHEIDSLLDKNKVIISNTKHLLIDVRDNLGGSTRSFENLLPYLYTNPIKIDGGKVLATDENIRNCYEKEYPNLSNKESNELKANAKKLRDHLGELYLLYKPRTLKLPKVLKKPERISILINNGTASSGELFILRAEQSKKVTLFGENTAGVVDYGETVKITLPCSFLTLVYPASKSLHSIKRPLDNVGIKPNIQIHDNISDWIKFVENYKKSN
ncbi:S41 family peptidase [Pedobacter jamesrossensis]|uniref:S41 family peptidase n=1 Tax=Pedobacter jamesrossensis TaxID=1908238 RepID=A0ABV8NR44_9SPHI